MAEWLVERGIGEDRAILVDRDDVLAARLRRPGKLAAGLITDAKLVSRHAGSRRGTVLVDGEAEALVDGLPKDIGEGGIIRITIVREGMAEKGRYKRAQARLTKAAPRPAPDLPTSLRASGLPVRVVRRFPGDPWPGIIGDAADGTVAFTGGAITISPTPAMTLIDVDGTLPPVSLAMAAVPAIAVALARLDIAGSIGIDFPTLERREDRKAVDDALALALAAWPHQSTAMNGFGFVQLVARLERPSILSRIQSDLHFAGATLLMRRMEDVREAGRLLGTGHPRVIAAIGGEEEAELRRRTGRAIAWHSDPSLAPLGGFAQALTS